MSDYWQPTTDDDTPTTDPSTKEPPVIRFDDTLAAFILARTADDEAAAHQALDAHWTSGPPRAVDPDRCRYCAILRAGDTCSLGHTTGVVDAADADHITRHDPARTLAEAHARRSIVQRAQAAADSFQNAACADLRDPAARVSYAFHRATLAAWDTALRLLATVWADHYDYRQEWTP